MQLPQKYIRDAIHNPLLFQQNNPLISESMSLLNSRHKRSNNDSQDIDQLTSKQLSARLKKKYHLQHQDEFQQSEGVHYEQHSHDRADSQDQENNEIENMRAIKEFERQIEEKFKISVANKLYTFPRLKITSIMDIISSSEQQDNKQQDISSKQTSQLTDHHFNPFDPKYYQKRAKTEHFHQDTKSKQNLHNKIKQDKNFKKVKISDKADKQKKNSSLKKNRQQTQNYSHRQKHKNVKKNPEALTLSKEKQKSKTQTQKTQKGSEKLGTLKNQKLWVVKQSQTKKSHYVERLKTEMDNGSSNMSESITQSKKRFYQQEFFARK